MTFKKGDRVVLQSDFSSTYGGEIKAGTLGTVTMNLQDISVIRYGYDEFNNKQIMSGVPMEFLRLATEEELKNLNIDYKQLISPQYHLGKQLIAGLGFKVDDIKVGDVLTIVNYKLASNENRDLLTVEFVDPDNGGFKEFNFDLSFVECYLSPYDEEFEKQLGEQIDLKGAERNYHLIGARMFLRSENPDNIVILENKISDSIFEVSDLTGRTTFAEKKELYPLTNDKVLHSPDKSKFIRPKFSLGKKFRATEEVSKHALLNEEFKPGDVVEIVHIDVISINSQDDTVAVERTGGDPVVVSVTELSTYFEEFKGMVKNINGKIKETASSVEDILLTIEEEMKNREEPELSPTPPTQSTSPTNIVFDINIQPEIEIHDVTINGFRFYDIKDGEFKLVNESLRIDRIEDLAEALEILDNLLKKR